MGRAIALNGFQLEEAQPLEQGLRDYTSDPQAVLRSVLDWTGGQPFLTQKLCRLLAAEPTIPAGKEAERIENFVRSRIITNWESQDEPEHLRTIRDRLIRNEQRKGQLLGLYQQILQAGDVPADATPEQIDLRLSGLVVEHQGKLAVYNRIYAAIFTQAWTETILASLRPYAEAISTWLASEQQDESRLLRGQALQDALDWANGKKLGDRDYEFLNASQKVDKRDMSIALNAQEEANRVLAEANQTLDNAKRKATRRLAIAGTLLGLTVPLAIGTGLWANRKVQQAQAKLAPIEANLNQREAELKDIWVFTEGEVRRGQGKTREALSILNQILKNNPNNRFAHLSRGFIYAEQKRHQDAETEFSTVIKIDPVNVTAYNGLGNALYAQNKFDDTIINYKKAISLDPNNVDAYLGLGNVLVVQNKLDDAIINHKEAIALDPSDAYAYTNLGNVLSAQNKLDDAIINHKEAIALDPSDAYAYTSLGNVLSAQNKLDDAITNYKKAIALDSKDAEAYNVLGYVLKDKRRLNEAIAAINQAIALAPKEPGFRDSMGDMQVARGNLDEAVKFYSKAIELDARSALPYANRGKIYYALRRYQEALADLNQAIALDPSLEWAIEARDEVLKQIKR